MSIQRLRPNPPERVKMIKTKLELLGADEYCARALFDREFPIPDRLIDALRMAPLVEEESLGPVDDDG